MVPVMDYCLVDPRRRLVFDNRMKDCQRNKNAKMSFMEHPSVLCLGSVVSAQGLPHTDKRWKSLEEQERRCSRAQKQGDKNMLGIIAAVLIVLWLFGFFAFHVTTSLIHIALVVGLVLLVLHFMRGSAASV
jgi:Flp pilus assembly protein TadB